ncbi:TauD/TfdA family dioxygenase [Gordonia effusa]|uniref:TauD/TfdA family dioxygenase n=1 Tax=Gordonia effusa TaxID=263908 RepID=UPI000A030878
MTVRLATLQSRREVPQTSRSSPKLLFACASINAVNEARHLALLSLRGWTWTDEEHVFSTLAARLGTTEVRGQILRPTVVDDARKGTHSATVGLGEFPWHTDGAIALNPPQWMVLRCIEANQPTSTQICIPTGDLRRALRRLTLLIRQESGRKAYLPAFVNSGPKEWRLRWDPRAIVIGPDDARAAVESAQPTDEVAWQPGRILILDNHRVMHRRPSVPAATGRALLRTFITK